MASIQRIVSALTGDVSFRAQVRAKGQRPQSATFPNKREAQAWAASIETAIREGRHFPHVAAKRTSFDALAEDYIKHALIDFDEHARAVRERHLAWWAEQFAGKSLAEVTSDEYLKRVTYSPLKHRRAASRARTRKQVRSKNRNNTSEAVRLRATTLRHCRTPCHLLCVNAA